MVAGAGVPVIAEGPGALLAAIARAASDPAVDPAKMRELYAIHREMVADQAKIAFTESMRACQAEIQPVVRDTENTQTRSFYAKLETVDRAIRPIYTKHGFTPSFDEGQSDETNMEIVCRLSHISGHTERYRLLAPPDTMGPKGTPTKTVLHGRGSTMTFLRRYLLFGIFNVVLRDKGSDDDGNRGGARYITPQQAAELEALLTEVKADRALFLRYFQIEDTTEMETEKLVRAINMLNEKRAPKEAKP